MASVAAPQPKTARREDERLRTQPEPGARREPGGGKLAADPARSSLLRAVADDRRRVQASLKVSQPGDAAEREAEATARAVMAMPEPSVEPRQRVSILAAREPAGPAPKADETSPELAGAIKAQLGGGSPLPAETRHFMQKRFKADFGGVRIHTGGRAENLATRLGANAFTYGRDIFFNAGQFQPESEAGLELIAHELTHTIQQREVVQREVQVSQRTGRQVQRGLISRALDWLADKANIIPGYRLFTIVIGVNPINMSKVERSGANILRAMIEFIPGGGLIVDAFNNHGLFEKGGKFIEDQFAALGMVGSAFRDALMEFLDSLGWSDLIHPGDVWDRAKRIFTAPVDRLIAFAKGLVSGIAQLIKDAILKPLGRWAAGNIPKWNLLVAVFGKNPISEEGESPAAAIIGAFMELIGQQEIWQNIQKGKAVARAWTWFKTALKGAMSLVASIPGRVMGVIRSLTLVDIVTIAGAFQKIVGAFASFVGDFARWAFGTVLSLLEIIFSVVAPRVVPYLKKAGSAFATIIRAPGRFISTLVRAGRQGFNQFKKNIVRHLRDALFKWLLGGAEGAGVYFPRSFAPLELLKMGLSVLGLTWANLRGKLVTATNETVVKALETGFDLVVTLVREGPAAAWRELLKSLANLRNMVVDAAIDFVRGEVVKIAIEKLVSFLTPAGAFIQAIIAIYRTISFIVSKLAQIGRLVAAFIDGLAALARGVVTAAANKVETVLVSGLSLAISFLANFAGLGNIPKKVMDIIKKIRAPVDKAMDKVVAWLVDQAKKLGKLLMGQDGKPAAETRTPAQKEAAVAAAQADANALILAPQATEKSILKGLDAIKLRHKLTAIAVNHDGKETFIEVTINPKRASKKRKFNPADMVVGDVIIIRHREIKMKGGEKITWIPGTATRVDQEAKNFDWQSSNLKRARTWAKIPFADQDVKWKKGHISQVVMSEVKMLELNESESWDSFADARAVLNWRHHEHQLNPSGKQWEHIIEQSAGGANASGNLALSDSTVNNTLGTLFGKPYASHEAPAGLPGTGGKPLRKALKGAPLYNQNRWKQFFYAQLGVGLKWVRSVRGRWRELS